jgi:hypothetical protein
VTRLLTWLLAEALLELRDTLCELAALRGQLAAALERARVAERDAAVAGEHAAGIASSLAAAQREAAFERGVADRLRGDLHAAELRERQALRGAEQVKADAAAERERYDETIARLVRERGEALAAARRVP